ncbi:MAG: PAS domain S-box protein, partial [Acidobacteriota bacterium]|nr:PAS domain S-box protein [Acidobacteriota bacterium]
AVAAQLAIGVVQAEFFQLVARGKQTWEATFDAMSDGVFIFGHARRLLRVNRAGAVLLQTSPQQLLGASCCDIFRVRGGGGCVVDQASDEGRAVTIEYAPDRSQRTLLVTAQPVRDGERLDGTVCTVRDLSELRKIEAVAREQQSLLTSIMESASEAIYALDPAGRFLWCNSKTVAMSGYAAQEIIGRHHLDLTFEADHEAVIQRFAEALSGVPQNYEMRYVTRDGNVRHAMIDNAPLVVDGRTTGVLGIARDISEQKQERERAAQSEKLRALGQLASGVAHDFNNSLAAILGRAQLLQRMTLDTELTRGLEIIQTAAQDAAVTVRRIRTFARQTEDEAFDVLDVSALLGDAVEITRTRWENEARARGLHYDVRLDAMMEGLFTEGSASELREVFVNLIVNAVDAMPEGGSLSISTQRLGRRGARRLRLLFADTGAGMSAEVSGRIFEPFFTTKGAQGTGLGLFVSYGIIERHLGRMSVASVPGSGTVITIELPLVRPPPPFIIEGTRPATVQTADSLAVLVVDDESIVRDTMTEMLRELGHRVISVDGGGSAIKALATHQFDVVFTDLSMPGMDGWDVAREVRRRQSGARVVIVTGHGKDGDSRNNWEEAADGIIAKPFDFTQVEEVLARVRSVTPHVGHVNLTS